MTSVYKIQRSDGLYSRGSGNGLAKIVRFDKKGKVWNNRGSLNSHLGAFKEVPDDWKIIELQLQPISVSSAKEQVQRKNRIKDLMIKYGISFSELYNKLEKDDKVDIFHYSILIKAKSAIDGVLSTIKSLKIKKGDYRYSSNKNSTTIAFADADQAMQFRLAYEDNCVCINLKTGVDDLEKF
jgi:hypothetical protein